MARSSGVASRSSTMRRNAPPPSLTIRPYPAASPRAVSTVTALPAR